MGRVKTLVRKTQPDDVEAQINALKRFQTHPAFIAGRDKKKQPGSWGKSLLQKIINVIAMLRKIPGVNHQK